MVAPFDPTCVLDLRGMYPFSSGGNRYVRDFSGYENHGLESAFNGDDSEYIDGPIGQEISVPGGFKYLNCGNSASLNPIGQISIETIVTPTLAADGGLIGKYNDAVTISYRIFLFTTGVVRLHLGGLGALDSPAGSVPANTMSDILCTYDGAARRIYVNGRQVATSAVTGLIPTNTHSLYVMSDGDGAVGNTFRGRFHRARIWNRAIGDAEIWDRFINVNRV